MSGLTVDQEIPVEDEVPAELEAAVEAPIKRKRRNGTSSKKAQTTVHPALWERIEKQAEMHGARPADIVRAALVRAFDFEEPEEA